MASGSFAIVTPHPPIFIPSVGGTRRHGADASLDALAFASRALAFFDPETVVLISPHAPLASDAFVVDRSEVVRGDLAQFGDDHRYEWPGDPDFASHLIGMLDAAGVDCIPRDVDARLEPGWADHATIVPLHFLELGPRVRLVVLSLSFLPYESHRRLGSIVASCAQELGRRVAFVASGDLSHRLTPDAPAGYSARGSELDAAIVEGVRAGRIGSLADLDPKLIDAGGECGLRSIIALGGFCGPDPLPARVLSYEGPWGVGYLTALVGQEALDAADHVQTVADVGRKGGAAGTPESEIVTLARRTIEEYVQAGKVPDPKLTDPAYPDRAGVFVSLHREGNLRGCIGTISPTMPTLAEEVVYNAVQASTQDPRFTPLRREELADLEVKVDVLHAPQACELEDLDPSRYGVIVMSGGRRGLLLPDLEGVDDVATQVSIALQKAGIPPGTPCALERFQVDRYS